MRAKIIEAVRSLCCVILLLCGLTVAGAQVLGDPEDVGRDFQLPENVFFVGSRLTEFDAASGAGSLVWDRYQRSYSLNFNKLDRGWTRAKATEFPGTEYDENPVLPFSVSFVDARTIRLRFNSRPGAFDDAPSLMLAGAVPQDNSWKVTETAEQVSYKSAYGEVRIIKNPWHIELYDAKGNLLTRTQTLGDPHSFLASTPFSFVRRTSDLGRRFAATFALAPGEKLFGGGESFTRLDKRGQRMNLTTRDAMGAQGPLQYKPIPFFLSSRGYAMFVHTSAPVTFDFGQSYDAHNTIYAADDRLDLFIFLGEPKDVLSEYTALTGRSPVPPLWSFGFWMSRITYNSEDQVRDVTAKLRQYRIPTDVIHLDTGWFETDWRSNYQFSKSRFRDPAAMIGDLRKQGFRVSLWQYTYFTPKNELFKEIVDNKFAVGSDDGARPFEDAVLDMSNPAAVKWYQDKLAALLKMGVGAIKVDFGENAPITGRYFSGRSGLYEHNLYPLRYNKAVADVTKEVTGDTIIWARSAWAGSQRYPLHWGGDAENTNSAMAAELRAGLSFGLSGFTYWSHDVGGFVDRAPRDLYRRWLAFGVLTSHTRAHGAPPREPWEYDAGLVEDFRRALDMRYSLMPYIYAQAADSSAKGHPMLRTLFFEFPQDETSWLVDDEYMFGSDLLVAPLFDESGSRKVYLPPGAWIDYQTGKSYEGARWHEIAVGAVPVVLLAKSGAVIPHVKPAQNTGEIDWNDVELRVFGGENKTLSTLFALPNEKPRTLEVAPSGKGWTIKNDFSNGKIKWTVRKAF
ncbi:MAG: DUF4968 domain-containing protein [Acidobacteria bacterium]|nr:DUF4968 domain-containing protein [Acidobacteriota bacterium]